MDNDFILTFGKHKGRRVSSMVGNTPSDFRYLIWLRENATNLKPWQMKILKDITK